MQIIDSWRERRRKQKAYRELSGFSDHILYDIGVTRSDLEALRRGRGLPQR
nr:DUF1127 domain-containing protein [uncultured Devosia sp.]